MPAAGAAWDGRMEVPTVGSFCFFGEENDEWIRMKRVLVLSLNGLLHVVSYFFFFFGKGRHHSLWSNRIKKNRLKLLGM